MHDYIKQILKNDTTSKEKQAEIELLKSSIEIADKIFSGEFAYCKKCDDYYLTRSFFTETEVIEERVCVYSDPINSSGDEYETKKVSYTYKYCPKGCKHQINRQELWK